MFLFWIKLIIPFIVILVPIWMGQWLGKRQKSTGGSGDHPGLGSVVAAGLGLFAFMLAFTFQITASRFESRKDLLLEDVNSIRKVYMNAGLLKDSNRIMCRKLIKEYLELRVLLSTNMAALNEVRDRTQQVQDSLWLQAEALAKEDRSSEIYALFISSVNELIDVNNKRLVVALQYHIPSLIMIVLYFISFFSMLILGFQFGISGKSNINVSFTLAAAFVAVMMLIYALDSPEAGIIKISQQPMLNLYEEIRKMP